MYYTFADIKQLIQTTYILQRIDEFQLNDEEEADRIYGQICDEIGVDINEEQQVNKARIPNQGQAVAVSEF